MGSDNGTGEGGDGSEVEGRCDRGEDVDIFDLLLLLLYFVVSM